MTSGAKFGGDFLAYPGDPVLYHAQYTVRCVHHGAPQHPLALAAATRMAHAARCVRCDCVPALRWRRLMRIDVCARRKHVVLASVHPAPEGMPLSEARVEYITFAPDIQQSTNRDRPGGHARFAAPLPALAAPAAAAAAAAAGEEPLTAADVEGGSAAPDAVALDPPF